MKRLALLSGLGALGILVVAFLALQLVPYGCDHTNPPVQAEPVWDTPQTRSLAVRACYDCHSNETRWPWYSNIAPVSWLVQRDVDKGRDELNFSEWNRGHDEGDDSAKTIREGEMPPWFYTIPHPDAQLSREEKARLVQGMEATFGQREHKQDRDRD